MSKTKAAYDTGLKTFFVAPDLSMIFPTFVESAFMQGYETYFIIDDHYLDIKIKVQALIDTFKELILFFTVDKGGSIQFWLDYISELQGTYGDHIRIGILYKNLHSQEVSERLKRSFLYEIGISCGCIPLHFSVQKNQNLLLNVLKANEAEGRRKTIRLECSEKYTFNIILPDFRLDGLVHDISISHFACSFGGADPQMAIWTFVHGIQLRLNGIICQVDAVLALKRIVNEKAIYVFVFRRGSDKDGPDEAMKVKINKLISDQYQSAMSDRLAKIYKRSLLRVADRPLE